MLQVMASVDRTTWYSPSSLRSPNDVVGGQLPAAPDVPGRNAIGSVQLRQFVSIGGVIVDAKVRPWIGGDVFECVVDDGTGKIVLAFLGRRTVGGMDVGMLLTADGVVGIHRGRQLILNPRYELWTQSD